MDSVSAFVGGIDFEPGLATSRTSRTLGYHCSFPPERASISSLVRLNEPSGDLMRLARCGSELLVRLARLARGIYDNRYIL
jgi:hypothetical protein